jgi:hypothetical protein
VRGDGVRALRKATGVGSGSGRRSALRRVGQAGYAWAAAHRRFLFGPASRIAWLRLVLAAAFAGGLLLSPRLWLSGRDYPLSPVSPLLPAVPFPLGRAWFALLLGLLAAIALLPRPRACLLAFVGLAGLLGLWDQSRWQPWCYQYLFLLAALGSYPWRDPGRDGPRREAALGACRLAVAGTYLWSGLQKLNASFATEVFPQLLRPFFPALAGAGPPLAHAVYAGGVAAALVEAGIGLGLLARPARRAAVFLALAMHAFILAAIGPLGLDVNRVVWPWNAAMALSVVILFWRTPDLPFRAVLRPRSAVGAVALVLFGVLPGLSFLGLWDCYLSACLYSGTTARAAVYLSAASRDRLPEGVRGYTRESRREPGSYLLDLESWSFGELGVPAYPEERVYRDVARQVWSRAGKPPGMALVIQERPGLLTTTRRVSRQDCARLGSP